MRVDYEICNIIVRTTVGCLMSVGRAKHIRINSTEEDRHRFDACYVS